MWRSNSLESFLADMDGLGIRPTYRATPRPDRAAPPRQPSLSLVRSRSDDDASTDCRRSVRRHIESTGARLRAPTGQATAAYALLDYLDLAIVLLEPGALVHRANAAARRISTRGDCFRIRARRLQLTDRQAQEALEEFLEKHTAEPAIPAGPRCLCRRSNGPCRYVTMAEWLGNPTSQAQAVAALVIYEPYRVGRVSAELLAPLYGLTPMESQLAAALYSVPRLEAAATRCGISVNTAKTHLKHVFSKCAVGSKAELLRLLALGPRSR